MPRQNASDLLGREMFKMTNNSYVDMTQNANLNNMFTIDCALIFRIGECKSNEVIYSKGHPTNPAQGSWSILNENKYLKIILHETNGVNSLVFKSTNQIFNTRKRITVGINFIDATSNIELFLNSLPESFALDTSQPHYRTNINQFTGLRVTTDNPTVGRGVGQIYGEFGLYYDLCETRVLTQAEHNTYYQPLIDNRVLPTLGKILFVSDRAASPFSVYEMDEDGANLITKDSTSSNSIYPRNAKNNNIDYCYNNDNQMIFNVSGSKYISTSHGSNNISSSFNATGSKLYRLAFFGADGQLQETNLGSLPTVNFTSTNASTNNGLYHIDCHPTDSNKMLIVSNNNDTNQPMSVYELNLTSFAKTLKFAVSFTDSNLVDRKTIYNGVRYSKDGTKIGFSCYYQRSGTTLFDLRAYIMNIDGTGLTLIGNNMNFCDFITNDKIIIEKTVSGPGYSNKKQLIIRDLLTNIETNITNHNSNNYHAIWRPA